MLRGKNDRLITGIALAILLLVSAAVLPFAYLSRPNATEHALSLLPRPTVTLASFSHASTEPSGVVITHSIATTGCGRPVSLKTGATSDIQTISGGQPRSYHIYLPTDYSNKTPHAVVLNFHGYDGDASLQETVSRFDVVANDNHFITVYPQGAPNQLGDRGWDTGLHSGLTANDRLFVSNILNQLQSNLCVKPAQIYATGFSNGGGFVNLLACSMSQRIAAFAPVSGSYVTPAADCQVPRPVPIIEFHGSSDSVNPYDGSPTKHEPSVPDWVAGWLQRDSCTAQPNVQYSNIDVIESSWTGCAQQSAVIQYKIIGEQHVWPNVLFSQVSGGKTSYVDAATIIWSFFAQHSLPA